MKKQFSAPYLRVVVIKNDIIATSGSRDTTSQIPVSDVGGSSRVAGRGAWDDEEDW